jgi:hypothetical protein
MKEAHEIKPEFEGKLAVYTLFEWIIDNPENQDKIIPLIEIESYFDKVKNNLNEIGEKYNYFSRIKDAFKKYKINSSIIEEFGLDYDNQNQCFILINKDKILSYIKIAKGTKSTEGTNNENKNITRKGTKSTESTENADLNKKNVPFVPCTVPFSKKNFDLIVQEERIIDLTNLIKDNDKGEGVSFDTLQGLSGWQEEELDRELKRLSTIGDIFEHKPDRWKVL